MWLNTLLEKTLTVIYGTKLIEMWRSYAQTIEYTQRTIYNESRMINL